MLREEQGVPPARSCSGGRRGLIWRNHSIPAEKTPGLTLEILVSSVSSRAAAFVSFPVAGIPLSDKGDLHTVACGYAAFQGVW